MEPRLVKIGAAAELPGTKPDTPTKVGGDRGAATCPEDQGRNQVLRHVRPAGVRNQQGEQFEDLEVTVDIRSTFTTVPKALLERLGVPAHRTARGRRADGRTVLVDIGWMLVRLEGQVFPTQVTFADEGEPPPLGAVTLREALLAVDPAGQRPIPADAERL